MLVFAGTLLLRPASPLQALLSREDLQHDLDAEREFSHELNKIVNQIRGADAPGLPMAPRRR